MGVKAVQAVVIVTALDDGFSGHINLAPIQPGGLPEHGISAGVEVVAVYLQAGVIVWRLPAAGRFVKNRGGRWAGSPDKRRAGC